MKGVVMNRKRPRRKDSWLVLLGGVLCFQLWCYSEPPEDHRNLSNAASWAVTRSNEVLLRALLQAGLQISEPIDDTGFTILHQATCANNEGLVKFIVDNGAKLDVRDMLGRRPIDYAYEDGRTNICLLLAQNVVQCDSIAGFPVAMLEEAFKTIPLTNRVWVLFNNKEPSDEMLKWLRVTQHWPNAIAFPVSNVIDRGGEDLSFREPIVHDNSDYSFAMNIVKESSDGYLCKSFMRTGREFVGIDRRRVTLRYGYWLSNLLPFEGF
jgi:ankyrin repeat protein